MPNEGHAVASKAKSTVFCYWPWAQSRHGSSNSPSAGLEKCCRFQFFAEICRSEKTVCVQSGARKSCHEPAHREARTTHWSSMFKEFIYTCCRELENCGEAKRHPLAAVMQCILDQPL
mmetsp:Transcript_57034/g.118324  ORF Transcript_57034/g.118324 Transcript_57034/m.118324 type:complete len:118 (-) Transcript_57034:1251-1604(-)